MDNQDLMKATILPSLFNDKAGRGVIANQLIEKIEEGEVEALKVHAFVKSLSEICDRLTDRKKFQKTASKYMDLLLSSAEQYGKRFHLHNSEFEVKETGVSYDYSNCGDAVILDLHAQLEQLKKKIKDREDFLKRISGSGYPSVDESTGEVVVIFPPSKKSTTTVTVKLK